MPNSWETVELNVAGRIYTEWKTVLVHKEFNVYPHTFTFTASEAVGSDGQYLTLDALQIVPGDPCTITLGGQLAITGWVNARQAAFDKDHHGVMIQGRSFTQDAVDSSMMQSGGEFKKQTFMALANTVLSPYGITVSDGGLTSVQNQPIDSVQIQPGESAPNMLDRLARMLGIHLTENETGQLMATPDMTFGQAGQVTEGYNIKSAQITISDAEVPRKTVVLAQNMGTDEEWGNRVSQIRASMLNPNIDRVRDRLIIAEGPMNQQQAVNRVNYEALWSSWATIDALITVYGWLDGGTTGKLWTPGTHVPVQTAMGMINGDLGLKAVTFSQDSAAGTQTTLEMVRVKDLANRLKLLGDPGQAQADPPPPDGQ